MRYGGVVIEPFFQGNHGDGDPDNTQTPFVAWGAGISRPNLTQSTSPDGLSELWGLSDVERVDMNQGDIAPLMVCNGGQAEFW